MKGKRTEALQWVCNGWYERGGRCLLDGGAKRATGRGLVRRNAPSGRIGSRVAEIGHGFIDDPLACWQDFIVVTLPAPHCPLSTVHSCQLLKGGRRMQRCAWRHLVLRIALRSPSDKLNVLACSKKKLLLLSVVPVSSSPRMAIIIPSLDALSMHVPEKSCRIGLHWLGTASIQRSAAQRHNPHNRSCNCG